MASVAGMLARPTRLGCAELPLANFTETLQRIPGACQYSLSPERSRQAHRHRSRHAPPPTAPGSPAAHHRAAPAAAPRRPRPPPRPAAVRAAAGRRGARLRLQPAGAGGPGTGLAGRLPGPRWPHPGERGAAPGLPGRPHPRRAHLRPARGDLGGLRAQQQLPVAVRQGPAGRQPVRARRPGGRPAVPRAQLPGRLLPLQRRRPVGPGPRRLPGARLPGRERGGRHLPAGR
jgi:hypothetical protein